MRTIQDRLRAAAKYRERREEGVYAQDMQEWKDAQVIDRLVTNLETVTEFLAGMDDLTDHEWQAVEAARSALSELKGSDG